MKIIQPSYEILHFDPEDIRRIERAARVCYKSEGNIEEGSAEKLIERLIRSGHEAMLEHSQMTVKFTVDRGVSHEMVRHRLASFAQESTRYCNYAKDKFGNEITVVEPCFFGDISDERKKLIQAVLKCNADSIEPLEPIEDLEVRYARWYDSCWFAETSYFQMLEAGATPQEARSVLPNSLKTEIVVTANYREWRHIFKLRTSIDAHPQIREVMIPLLDEMQRKAPSVFYDISYTLKL